MFGSEINHGYLLRESKNEADAAACPAFATQTNSLHAQPGRSAFGREADSVEEGKDPPKSQNIEKVGDLITIEDSDSVGATLVYNPSIANDDIPPKDTQFGITRTTLQTSGACTIATEPIPRTRMRRRSLAPTTPRWHRT